MRARRCALVEADGVKQKKTKKKNKKTKFVLVANELLCEHGVHALVEADGVGFHDTLAVVLLGHLFEKCAHELI